MRLIKSIAICFSMYSKIPMPKVSWDKENMRYAMCFFPLVGVVLALALFGVIWVCQTLQFSEILVGVFVAVLPIALTGGIHMDGFLDTADALASHQTKERKLEILKDSHTGAFAIISFGIYFALYIAIVANIEFNGTAILLIGCGYVLERCLCGMSVAKFRCAKNSGLLHTFADGAAKRTVFIVLVTITILLVTFMMVISLMSVIIIALAILIMIYYYFKSKKEFGGITGDLAGWFIQITEIAILLSVVILQKGGII